MFDVNKNMFDVNAHHATEWNKKSTDKLLDYIHNFAGWNWILTRETKYLNNTRSNLKFITNITSLANIFILVVWYFLWAFTNYNISRDIDKDTIIFMGSIYVCSLACYLSSLRNILYGYDHKIVYCELGRYKYGKMYEKLRQELEKEVKDRKKPSEIFENADFEHHNIQCNLPCIRETTMDKWSIKLEQIKANVEIVGNVVSFP